MRCKIRKIFYSLALVVCIVSLLLGVSGSPAFSLGEGSLPEPIVTGQSVEICLNSRDSVHPQTSTATDQQISNVLWGAGRAPLIGSNRTIYVATRNGTYLYDPDTHSLSWDSSDNTNVGAFKISYESELPFDDGLAFMPALLASVSLWDSTESPVASCPKTQSPGDVDLAFGVGQSVHGLDTDLVAVSSDASLPDPSTDGSNSLEAILANLNYTDNFTQTNLTLQQISQILWAGYGCTPHTGSGGRKALTVPSSVANYFLTEKIYFANEDGVYRYHNRLPSDNQTRSTRDHRTEQTKSDDVRDSLQSAVTGLPEAPFYAILCLDQTKVSAYDCLVEVGFVAFNMLMQATALDLGAHFNTELSPTEQNNVQTTANITSSHTPIAIVSIGGNAQMHALASYSNVTHTTPCDNFTDFGSEHTVFMYGTDLLPDHDYRVVYYEGDYTKRFTDDVTSGASGNISSQHTFVEGVDVAGPWNAIICEPYFTPSTSYNGSWAYTITSDNFTVQQSAIPEFPTVIAAIVAFSLCVGIYLWMRRKAVLVPAKSSTLW